MKTPTVTAESILAARLAAGLTQKQAAARVGVSTRAWQAYEQNEYMPSWRTWRLWELTEPKKGS